MSAETPRAAYGAELRHDRTELAASLAGASARPFWLDGPVTPREPALTGDIETDLLVVGGGFCGLWTALQAKEREPARDVVLIEARRIAWAASGRNGGFLEASLTHGEENGERHFADELAEIEVLAEENFREIRETLERYGIDAEYEDDGVLTVATEPHQVDALREAAAAGSGTGPGSVGAGSAEAGADAAGAAGVADAASEPASDAVFLEGDALAAYIDSPAARAGLFQSAGEALVHPAKLARGLKEACLALGVRIYESTPATGLKPSRTDAAVIVSTPAGSIRARRVALATNGFPSLLKRTELLTIPVYDYVLVTEPLTTEQLASIGWTGRHGITDSSRQFHYYRKTADDRILWGGYDAVYHRGGRIRREYDQRPETFERLADHFFTTFPQLRGTRFTHAWGGMIDMSTRFVAFQGVALGGRVAYSAGYTGLGVGATRFGAAVMLDLLAGETTARTRLKFATAKPFPIPPEPIAYPAITVVRGEIARSDANGGRDGVLLRAMELFGIGFDS